MDAITLGIIALAVLGGLVFAIEQAGDQAKGPKLAQKFADLGTLAGRSRAEIVSVVGEPNSVSSIGDGITLLQWQHHSYHIALSFIGDTCEGVQHEHLGS